MRNTGKGLPSPRVQLWLIDCDIYAKCDGSFPGPSESRQASQRGRRAAAPMAGREVVVCGGARAASQEQPGQRRTAQQRFQHHLDCGCAALRMTDWALAYVGFERSHRHFHFTKFIGWLA